MVPPVPMTLPATEVVVDLDEPETCPRCSSAMTAVELRLEAAANPAAVTDDAAGMSIGVPGSVATALPCRCVLSASTETKEPTMPQHVDGPSIPPPPADGPRAWHRWYAKAAGYFWLPCPLCSEEFGGHEWLPSTPELASDIPDPDGDPLVGAGICPACTRAGRGTDAWAASGRRYHLGNLPTDPTGPQEP